MLNISDYPTAAVAGQVIIETLSRDVILDVNGYTVLNDHKDTMSAAVRHWQTVHTQVDE